MIRILYASTLCSENVLNALFETSEQKPEQAVQKFHRLLAEGFAGNNEHCKIETVSVIPVTRKIHKRLFWRLPSESANGVNYRYPPVINVPGLKNVGIFVFTFFHVLAWSLFRIGRPKMVVCDILNVTLATATQLACKFTFTKCVAIVTDLPGLMVTNRKAKDNKFFSLLYRSLVSFILYRFSAYILLTEQMNEVVNKNGRPFMIMEGLVDVKMEKSDNVLDAKYREKVLIYAGGLYEKYGVKTLIDAFAQVSEPEARLHLYGPGELVEKMSDFTEKDPRLKYKGIAPNKEVVEAQLKATLLINPRPTTEEFTRYSFPSKNMEYMVSGTPMVCTRLPGMPGAYYEYIFVFEAETVAGMASTLEKILNKSPRELHEFGQKAREFVLKEKNNMKQAGRILDFYGSVIE
jgi:glycosyltransferase involved in cell wall biosynthesis